MNDITGSILKEISESRQAKYADEFALEFLARATSGASYWPLHFLKQMEHWDSGCPECAIAVLEIFERHGLIDRCYRFMRDDHEVEIGTEEVTYALLSKSSFVIHPDWGTEVPLDEVYLHWTNTEKMQLVELELNAAKGNEQ